MGKVVDTVENIMLVAQDVLWNAHSKGITSRAHPWVWRTESAYNLGRICKVLPTAIYPIGEDVVLRIGDLQLCVGTLEESFIINEVFVDRCYDFLSPDGTIVIDIGMNVGYASMFFADKEEVAAVYAFEPFPETYRCALKNFSLNPELAPKIMAHGYGLGRENTTRTAYFCSDYKGNCRTEEINECLSDETFVEQTISLKSASQALQPILQKHEDRNIVCKIDCEGAEYDIMEDLSQSGDLRYIDFIMMEFHDNRPKGDQILAAFLQEAGFNVKSFAPDENLIYAFRSDYYGAREIS